jgi:hypothetical protein
MEIFHCRLPDRVALLCSLALLRKRDEKEGKIKKEK